MKVTRRNFLVGLAGIPIVTRALASNVPQPKLESAPSSVQELGIPIKIELMNGSNFTGYASQQDLRAINHFHFSINHKENFTGYRVTDMRSNTVVGGAKFDRYLRMYPGDNLDIDYTMRLQKGSD